MLPSLSLKKSSSSSSGMMRLDHLPQKPPPPPQPSQEVDGDGDGDPARRTALRPYPRTKEFHRYDFTDENGHPNDDPLPSPSCPDETDKNARGHGNHPSPHNASNDGIDCTADIPDPRVQQLLVGRRSTTESSGDAEDFMNEDAKADDPHVVEPLRAASFATVVSVRVSADLPHGHHIDREEGEEEKVSDGVRRGAPTAAAADHLLVPSAESTDRDAESDRLDMSYSTSSGEDNDPVSSASSVREARTVPTARGRTTTTTTRRRSGWDVEVRLGRSGRRDDDHEEENRGSGARRRRSGRRCRPGAIAYQSFAILQCSAPAILPHLVPVSRRETGDEEGSASHHQNRKGKSSAAAHGEPDPKYRLCLPNASLDDWRLLEPFLQPPTLAPTEFGVHTATLTPQHLVLLPWFVQLRLHVLWEQSDEILSRIAWDSHKDPIQELLVWSHIAHAAQLQRTSLQACHAWQRLLSPHPILPWRGAPGFSASNPPQPHSIPPVMRLADDLESLASLCRLLEVWVVGRRHLWIHLVRYLPDDLDVCGAGRLRDDQSDAQGTDLVLLKNPLLPYLIREGIQRHCSAEASNDSSKFIHTEPTAPEPCTPPDDASLRSNRSTIGRTLLPLHPPSVSSMAKAESGRRRRGRPTPLEPRGAGDEVGEWQASFEQWFRWLVPMTQDELEDVAADIVYCPSSRASSVVNDEDDNDNDDVFGHEGASVASSTPLADILAKIPANRLQWLEEIWRRLQEPPILPPLPASNAQASPDRAAPTSDRQRSFGHPDTPPKHTARRRASRLAAEFSTPPRSCHSSSRHAAAQYPDSPGTTTEHSTSRSEQSSASASASAASRARLRRYSSPDRSASPRRKSVATSPGRCSATSSYCSKNDESNSSTLSTHPLNTSADGSEETTYSSIGVVRAKTRTFYC